MLRPVAVTALAKYKLRVEYVDGVSGEVDLSHLVGKGVFAAWNDPSAFEAVTIGEGGEFVWSDGIDLCSDAIYLEITGKSVEDLFPTLKAPADA
jgi:hypothetical protein